MLVSIHNEYLTLTVDTHGQKLVNRDTAAAPIPQTASHSILR